MARWHQLFLHQVRDFGCSSWNGESQESIHALRRGRGAAREGEKGHGQGKGTAATLCWAPCRLLLPGCGCRTGQGPFPGFQTLHMRGCKRRLRSGSQHGRTGMDPGTLCSCSKCEESPFTRHKQFPREAPSHSTGRRGSRAGRALQGFFLQGKNSRQSREESFQYKATPHSSCWSHTPSSRSIQGPGRCPHRKQGGGGTRKCLVLASFTHLAPEFLTKGASAARRVGRKKSWNLCYRKEFSKYWRFEGLCFFVSSRTGLLEKAHCTSELQHSTKFLPRVLQHFYFGARVLQEEVW